MALERSAHLLRLFGAHADGDGLIGAANDLAAATADLLEPEPLLRLTVLPLLIEMLASTRADVRLAACVALRTACRFEAVQQECAVLGAAPPLTKALSTGPAEVQLEACKAAEAIAGLNPDKKYTRDEVVLVLKDLTKEKPIEVARAILNQFSCARVSELKEEDFNKFVYACELAKKASMPV